MRRQKLWLVVATLALVLGSETQTTAGAVYVPDRNFGNAGSVFDPLFNLSMPDSSPRPAISWQTRSLQPVARATMTAIPRTH